MRSREIKKISQSAGAIEMLSEHHTLPLGDIIRVNTTQFRIGDEPMLANPVERAKPALENEIERDFG